MTLIGLDLNATRAGRFKATATARPSASPCAGRHDRDLPWP